jgi:enhancing lycopene biosynthesis protein 2
VFDGSEIHAAVLTLLALDQQNAQIICMPPDMDQLHAINHLTQEQHDERRNVLVESARIARGEIKDLKNVHAADLAALIVPGGFGAAKNLSDFALAGSDTTVHPEVERIMREMIASGN